MIEAHLKARRPLPAAIQRAPEILPGLGLYYLAFLDLQTHRQGTIPWMAIDDYGRRNEFSEDQLEALHHHIRHLDGVYLEATGKIHENASNVRRPDAQAGKSPPPIRN